MTHAWLLWLIAVAAFDFRRRRVPNWLSLVGAFGALVALLSESQPFGLGWSGALGGATVGFGVLLMLYATGLMGAGDVKFAGALGLWVGSAPLMPIWVGASVLAGVHAALWVALRHRTEFPWRLWAHAGPRRMHLTGQAAASGRRFRRGHIPCAAYLAIATLAWLAAGRTLSN